MINEILAATPLAPTGYRIIAEYFTVHHTVVLAHRIQTSGHGRQTNACAA